MAQRWVIGAAIAALVGGAAAIAAGDAGPADLSLRRVFVAATLFVAAIFLAFALIYWRMNKLRSARFGSRLGLSHFWLTSVGFILISAQGVWYAMSKTAIPFQTALVDFETAMSFWRPVLLTGYAALATGTIIFVCGVLKLASHYVRRQGDPA